ncbi:MAG: 16S rRNA (adenine(1518)-N(6)/adenine(1519)-N(6))-dimethyltransferase RsmA [Dehalococcoidia bacterium]
MPPSRLPGPRPRKALGQHFLRDTGVLADIVGAVRVPEGGLVVEIGAGTGQLTEALLDAGHEVVALEVEERLIPHLRKRFAGNQRLALVLADARDMDLAEVVRGRPFAVAGNLPYFAAKPIIRQMLERGTARPAEAVLMVQREVARELASSDGHGSLHAVSVLVYAETELLFDVAPEAFDPPPAVWSSVMRLTPRPEPLVPLERLKAFFELVSKTFRNPRKQIHNALSRGGALPPDHAGPALERAGIDPMRRPETLEIGEWLALLDAVQAVRANA